MENNIETSGTLFLIPSSLDQSGNTDFMVEEQRQKINDLKYFIVENEKEARKTIKRLNLKTPIQALTLIPHNKETSHALLLSYLMPAIHGENIGLLSDAGVPCIADPGSIFVKIAHENNIKIVPLICPSSIILSLMASGFNGQNFKFHGYIPIENIEKKKYILSMQNSITKDNETQIFIETPHRNNQLLSELIDSLGKEINLCVAVNLMTKNEIIISKKINYWKKTDLPDLSKQLCIFLLN